MLLPLASAHRLTERPGLGKKHTPSPESRPEPDKLQPTVGLGARRSDRSTLPGSSAVRDGDGGGGGGEDVYPMFGGGI